MTASRLSLALESGLVLPGTGPIAVYRPRVDTDLSALPQDRVRAVQGFRPDHDALAARGYAVSPDPVDRAAAALVILPRAKAEARALVAEAVRAVTGGPVIVDGQKTDGIDSLLKACRARAPVDGTVAKAHGKLFWFSGGDFGDWAAAAAPRRIAGDFVTRPGVFSADAPDPGSVALAAALPAKLPATLADLGAGWGYLARAALSREGVRQLHLVEAEHAALACAKQNLADPRTVFHWQDVTRWQPPDPLDAVLCNPPFHSGRGADPALGRAFVARAAAILKPSGRLWLVANRHLPYEAELRARFADVAELPGPPAYKLFLAAKPRRQTR